MTVIGSRCAPPRAWVVTKVRPHWHDGREQSNWNGIVSVKSPCGQGANCAKRRRLDDLLNYEEHMRASAA